MIRSDAHLLPADGSEPTDEAWKQVEALAADAALSVVVTSRNVAQLTACLEALADRSAVSAVSVVADRDDDPVDPSLLQDALQALGDLGLAHQPLVRLVGVAPCQVSLRALRDLDVALAPDVDTPRGPDLDACVGCPASPGCARPSPGASLQPSPPDMHHVRKVLARHGEVPRATPPVTALEVPAGEARAPSSSPPPDADDGQSAPPDGPPPIRRIRVIDEPEVWFIVEVPRPDAHYWFRNTSFGVYFSDPPRPTPLFAKLEGLLGKVRRKIDRLPPDRVRLEELVAIAHWARKAMQ